MTEQEAIERINAMGNECGFEEDCNDYECEKCSVARDMAISALEEVQQYRDIGTVEECREARERQRAKKPNIYGDGYDDEGKIIYDMYDCPNCDKSYELDYEEYDFCPNCGQAIDWGEETEDSGSC